MTRSPRTGPDASYYTSWYEPALSLITLRLTETSDIPDLIQYLLQLLFILALTISFQTDRKHLLFSQHLLGDSGLTLG